MTDLRPRKRSLEAEGVHIHVSPLPGSGASTREPSLIRVATVSHKRRTLATVGVLRVDHAHLKQSLAEVADLAGEPAADEVHRLLTSHQPPSRNLIAFDFTSRRTGPEAPLVLALALQGALLQLRGDSMHWGQGKLSTAISRTCGGELHDGGFILRRSTAKAAIQQTMKALLESNKGLRVVSPT